jgi:hypothetical protein
MPLQLIANISEMTVHVAYMNFAFMVVFMQQGDADKGKREMAMDDADRWQLSKCRG